MGFEGHLPPCVQVSLDSARVSMRGMVRLAFTTQSYLEHWADAVVVELGG